jgi:uncharacterized protein
VIRCRVTHAGVAIELGEAPAGARTVAEAIGRSACAEAGRTFVGVRSYARGAAFLRDHRDG